MEVTVAPGHGHRPTSTTDHMSSFFDKAKDKATHLANQAKEKVDESQHKHKADDLLDDIGRIIYRQRTTGTTKLEDDAAIDELVAQLRALADLGTEIIEVDAAAPASTLQPTELHDPATDSVASAAVQTPQQMPQPMPESGA